MFFAQNVAEALKKYRKKAGLTQKELAEELFVSTQSISKWERGDSLPDISHLCRLSEIFHISVDMLLGNYTSREQTFIGVDGGGTKTEFILISKKGALLKRVLLGGTNPNLLGIDAVTETLTQGIEALLAAETNVLGIFVGGSGFLTGDQYKTIQNRLRAVFPDIPIRCDSDIRNVFACSSDPERCIAVISGTGSVVFSDRNGQLLQTGGGGYLLDRAGSGYDIGRDVLSAVLDEEDGIGEKTELAPLLHRILKGSLREHLQEIYRKEPAYVASFAPLAEAAAAKKDPVALRILEQNSRRLEELITAARKKHPEANTVLLAGSMLVKGEAFRKALLARLDPSLKTELMVHPQIWGSLLQCAKFCGQIAPDAELFMSQYRLYTNTVEENEED